jgi:hypothetical protein
MMEEGPCSDPGPDEYDEYLEEDDDDDIVVNMYM